MTDDQSQRDLALASLIGRLMVGVTLGFLALMALRLFLYPDYGTSRGPSSLANWSFTIGFGVLLLPWRRWAQQPSRLQVAIGVLALIWFALSIQVSWTRGQVGWWVQLLSALIGALAVFSLGLGRSRPASLWGLNRRQWAALLVWLALVAANVLAAWFGPGAEPHEAHRMARSLITLGVVLTAWLALLQGSRQALAWPDLMRRVMASVLMVSSVTSGAGLLAWDWLQANSSQPLANAPGAGSLFIFWTLALLIALDRRRELWWRLAAAICLLWTPLASRVLPTVFDPLIPITAVLLPLLLKGRWQRALLPAWAALVGFMALAPGLDATQFTLHALSATLVLGLSWMLVHGLSRLDVPAASGASPAGGLAQVPRQAWRLGALVGLLVLGVGSASVYLNEQQRREVQAQALRQAAEGRLHAVVAELHDAMYRAHALVPALNADLPPTGQFRALAGALLHGQGPEFNLQWAPGGVIRYIEPLAGSEAALGLDLLSDPQRAPVYRALAAEGQPGWHGPFMLKEGVPSLAYNVPEFAQEPRKTFRGFVESVIRFPAEAASPWLAPHSQDRQIDFAVWLGPGRESLVQVAGAARIGSGAVQAEQVLQPYDASNNPPGAIQAVAADAPGAAPGQLLIRVAAWPSRADAGAWVSPLQLVLLAAVLLGWLAGWGTQFALARREVSARQREFDQMNEVLEKSRAGYAVFRSDGTVQWFSQRLLALNGMTPEQFSALNIWTHPVWQRWGLADGARRALTGEEVKPIPMRGIGTAGIPVDLEVTFRRITVAGEWHLLAQIDDLTEIHAQQAALQQSEASFRCLFENAPDAYLILSPGEGRLLDCNEAAARLLRGAREQIIGSTPLPFSPPLQPDGRTREQAAAEEIQAALAQGYRRFEWMMRPLEGEDFWTEVTASLGEYRGERVIYVAIREIGSIIAARQAAEAASLAKSQFLANMSHEIRTPLNGVQGFLQLALDEEANPRLHGHLERAYSATRVLSTLLNDLLDFSKIEAGKLDIHPQPFSLDVLLREVEQGAQALRGSKPVEVVVAAPGDDALAGAGRWLVADDLRLRQVLLNLMGNAMKFTAQGEVRLEVQALPSASDRQPVRLRIAVTDTGEGMSAEQVGRLFRPFEQADGSITRRFGGTGLGLTISQRLLQLMGSEGLQVRSSPGQGSSFVFELDCATAQAAPGLEPGSAGKAGGSPGPALAGRVLLLVEDNLTNIHLAVAILEGLGAELSIATNGQKALDLLREVGPQEFDAVLMDMQMPVMDGLTATRAIRQLPGFGRLPIIALTANAYEEDRRACLEAGMDDFVTKPLDRNLLAGSLQRVFQAAGFSAPAP